MLLWVKVIARSKKDYIERNNIKSKILGAKYLQIQDFKEDDDSQFYSDSQTSISFVPDEEYKKIKVVARRSGFYDMRYNKVLKKEIVSIFPADDQEENINNI